MKIKDNFSHKYLQSMIHWDDLVGSVQVGHRVENLVDKVMGLDQLRWLGCVLYLTTAHLVRQCLTSLEEEDMAPVYEVVDPRSESCWWIQTNWLGST